MTLTRTAGRTERVVLLASSRRVLASSLRAVLEPAGYGLRHVSDPASLAETVRSEPPDLVILDEDLVEQAAEALASEELGGPELPVLLYSAGSWKPARSGSAAGDIDARELEWEVIEEPIRSHDLLQRLERLFQLRSIWETAGGTDEGKQNALEEMFGGMSTLDSIASRSGAPLGCVVLGPTRPPSESELDPAGRDGMLSLVSAEVRESDMYAWVGPAEMVVILYGADVEGAGRFVSRLAGSAGSPLGGRELSAGIVAVEPPAYVRGAGAAGKGPRARLRVLEQVAAARRALDRARRAGGGVRVGSDA